MKSRFYSLLLICILLALVLVGLGRIDDGLAAPELQDTSYPEYFVPTDPYGWQPTTAVVPTSQFTPFPSGTRQTQAGTGLPTFSVTPSPPVGLTLTPPPPTATGPTATFAPLPSITILFPTPTHTPLALSSLSRPRPASVLEKEPVSAADQLKRYVPLLFILLIWLLLGVWFYFSARKLGPDTGGDDSADL